MFAGVGELEQCARRVWYSRAGDGDDGDEDDGDDGDDIVDDEAECPHYFGMQMIPAVWCKQSGRCKRMDGLLDTFGCSTLIWGGD